MEKPTPRPVSGVAALSGLLPSSPASVFHAGAATRVAASAAVRPAAKLGRMRIPRCKPHEYRLHSNERDLDPEPLEAVLFDLDGVLIDSYEVWFHLLNHTAAAFGARPISREVFHGCWGQGVAADVERFFPARSIRETEAHYHAHFMRFADHLKVTSDAPEVVGQLLASGLGIALVTNTPADLAQQILKRSRIEIATVVGGTDVEAAKPAPDMALLACERLSVPPTRTLLVGDSAYDAESAARAGIPFVGFQRAGDARIDRLPELLPLIAL